MAASSNNAVPVDQLERLLQCSICQKTLKDPRTLPCFHSYCNVCLKKFVKHHHIKSPAVKDLNCPVCRTKFTLGSKELPRNYFICSMLDVVAVQNRVKSVPCSHCKEPSVGRCVVCEVFMCTKCLRSHNDYPGFRKHSVLSMEELSKPENKSKIKGKSHCKKHPGKKLKFYCNTCDETICRRCMDFDHLRPDHECMSLESIAEEKLQALKISHSTLESKLKEGIVTLLELKNDALSLKNNMKEARRKIDERKREILATVEQSLERNAKRLVNETEEIFRKKHSAVVEEMKQEEIYVNKVKASVDLSSTLITNGNDEEIVFAEKLVQENVEEVESEHLINERSRQDDKVLHYNDDRIDALLMDDVLKKFGNPGERRRWCEGATAANDRGKLQFNPRTGKLRVVRENNIDNDVRMWISQFNCCEEPKEITKPN